MVKTVVEADGGQVGVDERPSDGAMALQRWAEEQPDLIGLDVNLPKLDGLVVCQRIREQDDTPILLLIVRGKEDEIAHGLGPGADDYITKSLSPCQLVARAHVVLRRAGKAALPTLCEAGDLILDPTRREIRVASGDVVTLTPLESRLLHYLMLHAGHVLTFEAIIDHVWGPEGGDRDTVRELVHRLRGKLAEAASPDATDQTYTETVPGLGYGLALPPPLNG